MSAYVGANGNVAAPRCFVDIYPFEGGVYTLTGDSAGLLSCTVSKSIRDPNPGTFALELVPGGPFGPNARPSWLDIITPLSLCVIGMQRGNYKQIVMVGVVLSVTEPQQFVPMQGVRRTISIQGADFQYFFAQRAFYALSFLYASPNASLTPVGMIAGLGDGLLAGTPDSVGKSWFNTIMAGTKGILANTSFSYATRTRPTFSEIMASLFQPYPSQAGLNLTIPMSDFFMVSEESWLAKFQKFFPFPWYEFFVITAPIGAYPGSTPATTMIDMAGFPPVSPTLVARVNPLPATTLKDLNVDTPNLQMDATAWNMLPTYNLDIGGTFSQDINFNDSEVRNYYIVNPLYTPFGSGNGNAELAPFIYSYASWVDTASIQRYGYRPQISEIHWLSDIKGAIAQQNAANGITTQEFNAFLGDIALKQTSYYEPTPLMAKGTCTFPLRPDILPGNKFSFMPFKNGEYWMFYIDAVSHNYQFGQQSTTTLMLSRGLPTNVYANTALTLDIHTGLAMRQNGLYASGLPAGASGSGLQPFNMKSMMGLLGDIAGQVFATPGAK